MTVRQAVSIVDSLSKGWYSPPVCYSNRTEFIYDSLSNAGVKEIKLYLLAHSDKNPISAVEDFIHQVDTFACNAKTGDANFMFSVYYDVGMHILDLLLGLQ